MSAPQREAVLVLTSCRQQRSNVAAQLLIGADSHWPDCKTDGFGDWENKFAFTASNHLTASWRIAKLHHMSLGRQRLRQYLERSRMNQREFARAIRITDSYLSQLLSGVRRPGLPTAVRLEAETGVPVASWVDTGVGKSSGTGKKTKQNAHI